MPIVGGAKAALPYRLDLGPLTESADLSQWIVRHYDHAALPKGPTMPQRPYDEPLLRQAFEVARRARDAGEHPFGSLLADKDGNVLREQANGYKSGGGDRTAHAERLLASWAGMNLSLDELASCTLYTSAEPCAMCAGTIYWAGIGRVVFGQSEHDVKGLTGAHVENPTLDLPCTVVFEAGQRPTEVVGPLLADEAAQLQADFWKNK